MRRDPQQRPGAVAGNPERAGEDVVPGQFHRGAVQRGDLQPLPQPLDAGARVAARRVQLEQAAHDLLAEQAPGLGERRAGRHPRARLEAQARQAESRGQGAVIARAGEQAGDQDADHGHLPGQRPVIGVPVRRFLQRPRDHALCQEVFQQALAPQLPEPVQPQPRPGQHPFREVSPRNGIAVPGRRGRDGRRHDEHGRLGTQQSSRRTEWSRQPPSYQELCSIQGPPRPITPPRSTRRQTVINPGKPGHQAQNSGKLRAVPPRLIEDDAASWTRTGDEVMRSVAASFTAIGILLAGAVGR